jgi:hypothetical protein
MSDSITSRLVIASALIAAALVAAPSAVAVDQTCATAGTTIVANSVARAYEVVNPSGVTVDACLYGRTSLQIASSDVTVNPIFKVALSGRYVAVATDLFEVDFRQASLRVYDLGTGRLLLHPRPATKGKLVEISALVLGGKAVAWIASRSNLRGGQISAPIYEVHRVNSHGAAVLDSGPRIAPGSLARSSSGNRIYWLNGNSLRTATL